MRIEDQVKVQKLYRKKKRQEQEEGTLNRDLLVIGGCLLLILLYDIFNLPYDVDSTVIKVQMVVHQPMYPW